MANIRQHIRIARVDHWFKNVFVLPGTAIAATLIGASPVDFAIPLLIGLASTCLVASSNYVINEWLDAPFDRFHPVKKHRASVTGEIGRTAVYSEYALLLAAGLLLAYGVSTRFFLVSCFFAVMGLAYNVWPVRTKDRVYLDVLSESVNNPIRLVLGWFIVMDEPLPPSSLLLGYWMAGAFLMGVKRYAELRFIDDPEVAGMYRRSFRFYSPDSLLISIFFYGACASFFLGVLLVKYRAELLLSLPFLALCFTWYLQIGMRPNSPTQHPERLYREKAFTAYLALVTALVGALFLVEIPWLDWFLNKAFIVADSGP